MSGSAGAGASRNALRIAAFLHREIARQRNMNWSRSRHGGQVERIDNQTGSIPRADANRRLRDRRKHRVQRKTLVRHRPQRRGGNLRCHGQQRSTIQICVGDAGHQIGRARPEGRGAYAWNSRDLPGYLRHPCRARLVSGKQKADSRAPACVDKRDNLAPGKSENILDAALGKSSGDDFSVSGHGFIGRGEMNRSSESLPAARILRY